MSAAANVRFRFGENWRSFLSTIDPESIETAKASLRTMLRKDTLTGLRFLDIGCGSGLFSLAARELGASVYSFDFDADCVTCAQALKDRYRPNDPAWTIEKGSILDNPYLTSLGKFDAVYAWGVLHHTGDMSAAILNAAALVGPDGALAIALYRKTPMCGFWAREKRWYAQASPGGQRIARMLYVNAFRVGLFVTGRSLRARIENYKTNGRAMDFYHDAHDWLGGYPYESISMNDTIGLLSAYGFDCEHSNCQKPKLGLFGSGCDEFVFKRRQ
jgi:2-polyprenyl-3-methyl-5-hydroxy-6-metoxy-1,4-benzoquinol methylase